MPTYVYACNECGAQFEQFQRFSDEPIKTCPRCQGVVRRVFQPVGIVFKGSGWYITDSRSSKSASTTSSTSDSTKDGSTSETSATTESTDSSTTTKTDTPTKDSTPTKESSTSTSS